MDPDMVKGHMYDMGRGHMYDMGRGHNGMPLEYIKIIVKVYM